MTLLQQLVNQKDDFKWELIQSSGDEHATLYQILMTSQQWRNQSEVSNPFWRHTLYVIVPKEIRHQSALLSVVGGTAGQEIKPTSFALDRAKEHHCVVVELSLVPNQSLYFTDDENKKYQETGRIEDQLVAYSWKKFLETEDPAWPLQVPMTRSIIRAMDCIEEFSKKHLQPIREFFITGHSKRGWVTWLAGAIDDRVVGVAPCVIDILNLRESIAHHYNVYGKWSPEISDYEKEGIDKWIHTEPFTKLLQLIEPYHYRDKLTMPKYIINAASDDYFLPDSSQFYFQNLMGPKYLRYIPNSSHNLAENSEVMAGIGVFYQMVSEKKNLPRFYWARKKTETIEVEWVDPPIKMKLWSADNPNQYDFRYSVIGPCWKSQKIDLDSSRIEVSLEIPKKGWRAYFVELTFLNEDQKTLIFTTDVIVVSKETLCK